MDFVTWQHCTAASQSSKYQLIVIHCPLTLLLWFCYCAACQCLQCDSVTFHFARVTSSCVASSCNRSMLLQTESIRAAVHLNFGCKSTVSTPCRQSVCVFQCVCVRARLHVGNVAAGIGSPLRILAHYTKVTAHAWPLPPWPPSGEQSMLGCGSHVLVTNNPTSCPTFRERHTQRNTLGESEPWLLAATCCAHFLHSHALSVSRSYSLASWLFTPAQAARLQYWEQNTHWPSCSKYPPTLLCIKTWVTWACINFIPGGFYMCDFLSYWTELCEVDWSEVTVLLHWRSTMNTFFWSEYLWPRHPLRSGKLYTVIVTFFQNDIFSLCFITKPINVPSGMRTMSSQLLNPLWRFKQLLIRSHHLWTSLFTLSCPTAQNLKSNNR